MPTAVNVLIITVTVLILITSNYCSAAINALTAVIALITTVTVFAAVTALTSTVTVFIALTAV
jgi:hypothetical protein